MISAIIPVYGESPFLHKCLASLGGQVDEVVVVDDGSPPPFTRIRQWVQVQLKENQGFSVACNAGATQAKGDWLAFINSDVELIPGCIAKMLEVSTWQTIVGPKLLYPDDTIQHGGVVYQSSNGWCDHRFRFHPRDCPGAAATEPCLVTGALLLMHRTWFQKLGGFDPAFRMAWEDIDLQMRGILAGGASIYQGQAEAYHLEGATRGRTQEEKADRDPKWAEWERQAFETFHGRYSEEELSGILGHVGGGWRLTGATN